MTTILWLLILAAVAVGCFYLGWKANGKRDMNLVSDPKNEDAQKERLRRGLK